MTISDFLQKYKTVMYPIFWPIYIFSLILPLFYIWAPAPVELFARSCCQAKPIQRLRRASPGVDWSWSQCIKSHHAQTSSGKGLPKPLLKQKQHQKHLTWTKEKKNWTLPQWSKVLFSDKSKFCISFGNQGLESGGRLERHRIQAAWSPVWSCRSQWWFGVLWHLLVLVHCVLSSP